MIRNQAKSQIPHNEIKHLYSVHITVHDHKHSKMQGEAYLGPTHSNRHQAETIRDIHKAKNIAMTRETVPETA